MGITERAVHNPAGVAVTVPRDALVFRGSEMFVLRTTPGNTVEKVNADTGTGVR
jgi:hypothetical protein